jgi:hypothetical protein
MTRHSRSLPALFAILLAAQSAYAQPRPVRPAAPVDVRSELPDAAKRAWDAAKELAGANNFKGAVVEFLRAYELSQNPRVLYNVGVAEKLQTHYARAVDAWERELREATGKLSPAESAEVTNAISVVQQYISPVEITANEADATLSVDDYAAGKTPFAGPVHMDVGHHTLTLKKEGFIDLTQQIDVAAGQKQALTLTLEPTKKTAIIKVATAGAPGAIIYLDGADVGPAPYTGEVLAGHHTIEARAHGYATVGQSVDVVYKQPMSLMLTLAQERHEGRLRVTAPDGADIAIDSRKVGTGTWEGVVSTTGSHELVVTKSGFQTYATEVNVPDDGSAEKNVQLNKEVGTSWVGWGVGSLLVVTGGIVAGYYIFKPATASPYVGDFIPGITDAHFGGIHF